MKKETIKVFYKRPGKNLVEVEIPNELDWLQGAVEGYIEAATLRKGENGMPDLVMLCNEEGKLKEMEPNFLWLYDQVVGPVLFVGADDEGDFTDCPMNLKELKSALIVQGILLGVKS